MSGAASCWRSAVIILIGRCNRPEVTFKLPAEKSVSKGAKIPQASVPIGKECHGCLASYGLCAPQS